MSTLLLLVILFVALMTLAMMKARLWQWAATLAVITLVWQMGLLSGQLSLPLSSLGQVLAFLPAAILGALSVDGIREALVVKPAFAMVKSILPKVSDTEQQALDAGTVGFDAEIFSGQPNWRVLSAVPANKLTAEEQAFLDGPTDELCAMIDDWEIRFNEREIPEPIWDFVKSNGFLGMLISKDHGGLGFSAQAQSLILGKIASRSPDVATIVMVPNSLGPGELIEKYGTDQQKSHFLPRLAKGLEVPCFSLTGPTSGSDAATMRDIGRVEKGTFEGKETLGITLSWDKRYITLGPKATLVGLAFRLFDPGNLLDRGEDLGITVALIPADHPGMNIGRRHLPSGSAFPNGPNWGKDVFIPMEWVIGGDKMAGQGWRMLMECLAAGRAISLPSSATAGAKAMLRHTTAYGRIRKQFGLPVSRMEGVEEALVRIIEAAYVNEAARGVTAAMVSRGDKPSVISALMKYQTTERMRDAVNAAMDIHGGKAICDGPSNYLQSAYQMVPVGITVEGANILTRTLITFAQGALRSHPYLYSEIQAAQNPDKKQGFTDFEKAFTGHISFAVSNVAGSLFHNLTGGRFANEPATTNGMAHWYRQVGRQSRNFALVADMMVAMLGGGLKTKQRLTGRMADCLSELYFLSCVLKRYNDDGAPQADVDIVNMVAMNGLYRSQQALGAAIDNFPVTWARLLMRTCVFPFGRRYRPAPDSLARSVAKAAGEPGDVRDRLTRQIYISKDVNDPTGLLEVTLAKVIEAEPAEKKLDKAVRSGTVQRYHGIDWFAQAVEKGVLTQAEADLLKEVEELVARVIAVDHFDPVEVKPHHMKPGHNQSAGDASAAE